MLLTLGRGLAPAGRGEGVEAPPLRLTDLVPGLTANWEVFNESLLDTTGNGHHLTLAGGATFATINGAAPGIGLDGTESHFIICNSLAITLNGDDTAFSLVWLVEQTNTAGGYAHFSAHDADGDSALYYRTRGANQGMQARRFDGSSLVTANSSDSAYDGSLALFIFEFSGTAVTTYKDGGVLTSQDGAPLNTGALAGLDSFWWGAQQSDTDPTPESMVPGIMAPICAKVGSNFSSANRSAIQGFVDGKYGRS